MTAPYPQCEICKGKGSYTESHGSPYGSETVNCSCGIEDPRQLTPMGELKIEVCRLIELVPTGLLSADQEKVYRMALRDAEALIASKLPAEQQVIEDSYKTGRSDANSEIASENDRNAKSYYNENFRTD